MVYLWLRLSQERAAEDVNLNIASRCFYLAVLIVSLTLFDFYPLSPKILKVLLVTPVSIKISQFKQFVFIVHACIVNYRSRVSRVRQVGSALPSP